MKPHYYLDTFELPDRSASGGRIATRPARFIQAGTSEHTATQRALAMLRGYECGQIAVMQERPSEWGNVGGDARRIIRYAVRHSASQAPAYEPDNQTPADDERPALFLE